MALKLKASARINRRYLLIGAEESAERVRQALLEALGEIGFAKASPMFVKSKNFNGKIILAVARGELENVRAAIELSKDKIKVLKVSGTLKGLGKV